MLSDASVNHRSAHDYIRRQRAEAEARNNNKPSKCGKSAEQADDIRIAELTLQSITHDFVLTL
jgi:hypothetical protein